jgi:plasmid stability protein
MIQIRNVPDTLHRELKMRAAGAGMTLSDYLMQVIRQAVTRPEREVLLKRIRERSHVNLNESPAEAVRAIRDGR